MNVTVPDFSDSAALGFFGAGNSYRMAQFTKTASSQKQNADITITTAEGDKVTLSAASEYRADYLTYSSLGRMANSQYSAQAYSLKLEESRDLIILVEGDLSDQELEDIQKMLHTLDKIMKDVLSGNVDQAMKRALKVAGYDSISAFEADLQVERVMSFEQQSLLNVPSSDPETIQENQAGKGKKDPFRQVDTLTDLMMNTVRKTRGKKGKLLKPMRQLISQLLREPSHRDRPESPGMELANKVGSAFIKKMEGCTERELEAPEECMGRMGEA